MLAILVGDAELAYEKEQINFITQHVSVKDKEMINYQGQYYVPI